MNRTHNGDFAYESTGNALVEFFSKAGSLFKKKGTFYGGEAKAVDLFKPAWSTNNYKAMQLAMWLRDCRGGAGNRSGFREVLTWIATENPEWVEANMHLIPMVGRWDDLEALIGTSCEKSALDFWVRAIQDENQLAAKWAPRAKGNREVFNKLRKVADMTPKEFRKLLVENTNVVETAMCQKDWSKIDYSKVPSVAMARYNNAFKGHDTARYESWKSALEKGVDDEGNAVKVNASVLFPHDVIRTLKADSGSADLCNAQFAALPNYMGETNMRIMPICDFSGSMTTPVSGMIQAIDVSMALGLYCSDRLGEKNPFYRKFIPFSTTSNLVDWKKETFAVASRKYMNGYCGSTNIRSALDKILEAAKMFNATNEQIPNALLIISDMQFDCGNTAGMTSVEAGLKAWEDAGYSKPKIVYWNLAGYANSPSTVKHQNVGLVSGFSPSLLKAVLGGTDFNPMAILNRAIEKYEVIDPDTGKSRAKAKTKESSLTKRVKNAKLAEDWTDEEIEAALPKKRAEKGQKSKKRTNSSKKRKA